MDQRGDQDRRGLDQGCQVALKIVGAEIKIGEILIKFIKFGEYGINGIKDDKDAVKFGEVCIKELFEYVFE